MKHTQGKWETHPVTDFNVVYVVVNGEAEEICRTPNVTPTDKANARRIVAAVNAVEGITTEALEFAAEENIRLDFAGRSARITELESSIPAVNARLLGVLKTIQSYDEGNGCCPYGCDCPTIARAAIAEAEETVQPRTTAVEPPAQRLFKATKEITSYLRKQYPWNLSEPFKSLLIEAENALDDPHGYEPKGIVAPVKQPEKRTGAPTTGAGIARLYGGAALCKLYLPPPLKHIMYNVFLLEKNKYVLRGSGTLAEVRAILYRKKQHGYIVLA